MTPLDQLRSKPRNVQLVLMACIFARAGVTHFPTKPSPDQYATHASVILENWEKQRAKQPHLSESELAADFIAYMGPDFHPILEKLDSLFPSLP